MLWIRVLFTYQNICFTRKIQYYCNWISLHLSLVKGWQLWTPGKYMLRKGMRRVRIFMIFKGSAGSHLEEKIIWGRKKCQNLLFWGCFLKWFAHVLTQGVFLNSGFLIFWEGKKEKGKLTVNIANVFFFPLDYVHFPHKLKVASMLYGHADPWWHMLHGRLINTWYLIPHQLWRSFQGETKFTKASVKSLSNYTWQVSVYLQRALVKMTMNELERRKLDRFPGCKQSMWNYVLTYSWLHRGIFCW